eukprot:scaffold84749_cov69-Phaeocystis_antarctica.AAC.2
MNAAAALVWLCGQRYDRHNHDDVVGGRESRRRIVVGPGGCGGTVRARDPRHDVSQINLHSNTSHSLGPVTVDQPALDALSLLLDRAASAHAAAQLPPQDGAEDLAVDAGGATSDRAGGAESNRADHADLRLCGPRLGGVRGARGVEPTAAGGRLHPHGFLLTPNLRAY